LLGSVLVFVQVAPPHCSNEPEQLAAQVPSLQTRPVPQVVPQVPQLWRSVCMFTQEPLQAVRGKAQVSGPLSAAASEAVASSPPVVASIPEAPLEELAPDDEAPEEPLPEELAPDDPPDAPLDDDPPEELLAPEELPAPDELPPWAVPLDEPPPEDVPASTPVPRELVALEPPHAANAAHSPMSRTFPLVIPVPPVRSVAKAQRPQN
jgi:hypothetical protein